MKDNQFFEKQTSSSKIKASIISEYFPSYCKIIVKRIMPKELRYVDLFAGPGIYDDGNYSTPILIANHCKNDEFLRNNVRLMFNDMHYKDSLQENFNKYFSTDTFVKQPYFADRIVGQDERIRAFLTRDTHRNGVNECPTLLFIDPFGYKGIETNVLAQFLKNWGNEIFLFVNIKRIHPALENEKFDDLMNDLFPTTLAKVRNDRRYKLNTSERIGLIIQCLGEEYESILKSKVYYTAFKFKEEDSDATSHYILHITKGSRGFDLVKTIYTDFANVGTIFDGINTYTFDAKKLDNSSFELFDSNTANIDKLKDELLVLYKGKSLSANDLFEQHQIGNIYSRRHYTDALRKLVEEGMIVSTFTDNREHSVSVLISQYCNLKFLN